MLFSSVQILRGFILAYFYLDLLSVMCYFHPKLSNEVTMFTSRKTDVTELKTSNSRFSATVTYDLSSQEAPIPRELCIRDKETKHTVMRTTMDAVDSMLFTTCHFRSDQEALDAIPVFAEVIKTNFGGKNLIVADSKQTQQITAFAKAGFHITPQTSDGQPYNRFLTVPRKQAEDRLKAILSLRAKPQKISDAVDIQYVQDKKALHAKVPQLEALFKDAPYATSPAKQRFYTREGIPARLGLDDSCVHVFVAETKKEGPIACMRAYAFDHGRALYLSDLVTKEEARHQEQALLLEAFASKHIPATAQDLFFIAGDEKELTYYKEALGARSLADFNNTSHSSVVLLGLHPAPQ